MFRSVAFDISEEHETRHSQLGAWEQCSTPLGLPSGSAEAILNQLENQAVNLSPVGPPAVKLLPENANGEAVSAGNSSVEAVSAVNSSWEAVSAGISSGEAVSAGNASGEAISSRAYGRRWAVSTGWSGGAARVPGGDAGPPEKGHGRCLHQYLPWTTQVSENTTSPVVKVKDFLPTTGAQFQRW